MLGNHARGFHAGFVLLLACTYKYRVATQNSCFLQQKLEIFESEEFSVFALLEYYNFRYSFVNSNDTASFKDSNRETEAEQASLSVVQVSV